MNLNITMMDLTPCYVAFDRFLFRDVRFAIGSVGYIHTPKGSGEIYNIKSFLVPFLFRHNICLLAVPETPEHAIVGLSTIPIPTLCFDTHSCQPCDVSKGTDRGWRNPTPHTMLNII